MNGVALQWSVAGSLSNNQKQIQITIWWWDDGQWAPNKQMAAAERLVRLVTSGTGWSIYIFSSTSICQKKSNYHFVILETTVFLESLENELLEWAFLMVHFKIYFTTCRAHFWNQSNVKLLIIINGLQANVSCQCMFPLVFKGKSLNESTAAHVSECQKAFDIVTNNHQ